MCVFALSGTDSGCDLEQPAEPLPTATAGSAAASRSGVWGGGGVPHTLGFCQHHDYPLWPWCGNPPKPALQSLWLL